MIPFINISVGNSKRQLVSKDPTLSCVKEMSTHAVTTSDSLCGPDVGGFRLDLEHKGLGACPWQRGMEREESMNPWWGAGEGKVSEKEGGGGG